MEDGGLHLPEGRDWSIGSTCQLLYGHGSTLPSAAEGVGLLFVAQSFLGFQAPYRSHLNTIQNAKRTVKPAQSESLPTPLAASESRDPPFPPPAGTSLQRGATLSAPECLPAVAPLQLLAVRACLARPFGEVR